MFLLTYFFYILTYFSTYYKLIDQNTNFLYIVLGFNGGNYQLVGLFYCDKYSRETTIQGRKLFAEIRYAENMIKMLGAIWDLPAN